MYKNCTPDGRRATKTKTLPNSSGNGIQDKADYKEVRSTGRRFRKGLEKYREKEIETVVENGSLIINDPNLKED